jgi:hypothetical protein
MTSDDLITADAAVPFCNFKSSTASLVIEAVMMIPADVDLYVRGRRASGHLDDGTLQNVACA